MSVSHKISLIANWKLSRVQVPDLQNASAISAVRIFHCPSGLTDDQPVMLCFANLNSSTELFMEDKPLKSVIVEGATSVPVRPLLQTSNRIEIRWHSTDSSEVLELPERFSAWLEISETATP